MSNVEFYIKLKIRDGQIPQFKRHVDAIVDMARQQDETLRNDWFLHEGKAESVVMAVYRDDAAFRAHHAAAREHFDAVADMCDASLEFLGEIAADTESALRAFNPRVFRFAYGIKPSSTTMHEALRSPNGIEIYTKFTIFPGHLDSCKQVGADLIPIVSSKDPGTSRYDWFYDDEKLQGIAMDCYLDTPSMFAHMKNAHDVHELLFDHSTMITEFLGELPEDAKAAVARYNPYVLPLYAGLRKTG